MWPLVSIPQCQIGLVIKLKITYGNFLSNLFPIMLYQTHIELNLDCIRTYWFFGYTTLEIFDKKKQHCVLVIDKYNNLHAF
jgi:hypothetical protein